MPQGVRPWTTYAGHSEDGSKGMIFGGTPSLLSPRDRRHGEVQEDEHKDHWQRGCCTYRTTRRTTWQPHASHVATQQEGFVQIANWLSAQAVPEQDKKLSVVKKAERKAWKADMSCPQSDLVRQQPSSSDASSCSLPPRQPGDLEGQGFWCSGYGMVGVAVVTGLATLSMKQKPAVQCAGKDDSEVEFVNPGGTSSGSSSVGPARWAAVTALEIAARERVATWRAERGLEDDSDFAFRWSSHEEAVAGAGHAVAHEWLRARAEQRDALLPAVARVMDEIPRPAPSTAPALLREAVSKKGKTMFGKKRQGVRLRANPTDTPEAECQRVEALTTVMMKFGALEPSGHMNAALHEEWRQSCFRLSQRLVTQAEPVTILNALKTAGELQGFMRQRERSCVPEKVDIDAYLHSSTTPAPVRALASLKWLNNNGQLG